MSSRDCGPAVVVLAPGAGEHVDLQRVAQQIKGVTDRRDLDRTARSVATLSALTHRRVSSWAGANWAPGADEVLEWWFPVEERDRYECLRADLDGGQALFLESIEHEGYVHQRVRLQAVPPLPSDTATLDVPTGLVERVAIMVHRHRGHPPYPEQLAVQVLLQIAGRGTAMVLAEGYDVDEWALFDHCDRLLVDPARLSPEWTTGTTWTEDRSLPDTRRLDQGLSRRHR